MGLVPAGARRSIQPLLRPLHKILFSKINHIIFIPTLRCNYHCPYCLINKINYPQKYPQTSERGWEDWVKVFEKIPSSMVFISGGEPFLYSNLVKLIKNLPKKHLVATLTTNLSLSDAVLSEIPKKIFQIEASFHPHMAGLKSFTEKVLNLKKQGFQIKINFVAYPKIINLIPTLKDHFEKKIGVIFNVDSYIDPAYHYTPEEIKIIKKYIPKNRKMGYQLNDNKLKKCQAGSRYFIFLPNGDVYTCHAGFYSATSPFHKTENFKEKFYLGNLFDGTFKPLTEPIKCSIPCCEACDITWANPKALK